MVKYAETAAQRAHRERCGLWWAVNRPTTTKGQDKHESGDRIRAVDILTCCTAQFVNSSTRHAAYIFGYESNGTNGREGVDGYDHKGFFGEP